MSETKVCISCGRELPLNRNYYYQCNRRGKKGFKGRCRECLGYSFLPEAKEGYQICSKCGEELPLNEEYFEKSKTGFTGFRRDCRKCSNEASRQWREKHPDKVKEYEYNRWHDNMDKEKARHKEYYDKNHIAIVEKAKDYYWENKDEISNKKKQARRNDPEHFREMDKKYRERNKEKRNEQNRIRYWLNRDWNIEYNHKYHDEHRDELAQKKRKKRANRTEEEREREREYYRRNRERYKLACSQYRYKKKQLPSNLTQEEWKSIQEYFDNSCAYCGKQVDVFEQEHVIPVSKGGYYVASNIICACKNCNTSKSNADMESWYRSQPFFSESRLKKIYKWTRLKPNSQIQQMSMF